MLAILNVHKDSAYSHLNGQSFKVKKILPTDKGLVVLEILNNGTVVETDFTKSEVFIVKN